MEGLFTRLVTLSLQVTEKEETCLEEKKMKRVKIMVLFGMVLLLGACSKSPKEEFMDAYDLLTSKEYDAGKFEVSVIDFQINPTTKEAWGSQLSENFENMLIKGDYKHIEKDESFCYEGNIILYDKMVPFEIVGKEGNGYLSASSIQKMIPFMYGFDTFTEVNPPQLNDLEGKYIKLFSEEMKAAEDNKNMPDSSRVRDKIYDLLKDAKEESFKIDGDTISHTINEENTKKADKNNDFGRNLEMDMLNTTLTLEINKKTMKTDCTVKMLDSRQEKTIKAIITPSKNKADSSFSLPKKKDIMSVEELLSILSDPQIMSGVHSGAVQDDEEIKELTDAEFEMLYQQLEADFSELDLTHRQAILSAYSSYLNDEQFARLESLLNQ